MQNMTDYEKQKLSLIRQLIADLRKAQPQRETSSEPACQETKLQQHLDFD